MSERKRFLTPNQNLNSTMLSKKNSASKRFSPNITRAAFNETLCSGASENPNIKPSLTSGVLKSQILDTECDLVYNDYLQSLLKYEIIDKEIKEQQKTLHGQMLLQEANVRKRTEVLKQIQSDTELLIKKEEVVKMIKTLEENINGIQNIYGNCQTKKQLDLVHTILQDQTNIIVLKNIEPITTQDQYNELVDSLKKLVIACEKIVNCGRDFEGVHLLAEECRNLSQLQKKFLESQVLLSTMETHAINTVLQKLSDAFAKQYENIED